jgi:hypothetical protein
VNLNAGYENMLAQNVAWSADMAGRAMAEPPRDGCYVGKFTCEQAAAVIELNADHWRLFWEASQGE